VRPRSVSYALVALAAVLLVTAGAAATTRVKRPHIVWKPIPFGAKRKAETTKYVRRHYGSGTWRLRHPHVIVEHYTATTTFQPVWNTFASDEPDPELHELPGTCAHFVIDRDGTIYQLVKTRIVCRHTVGLNYTALGIEHVGTSDQEILSNKKQMRSSLRLTLWLVRRFHIKLKNVIGHNESLTSPYHKELYKAWRCQTHGDWKHADMKIYRRRLRKLALRIGIHLGPGPGRRPVRC
jgi:N-acetylmuramoyl-L-alanine amidase-like protein